MSKTYSIYEKGLKMIRINETIT